MSESSVSFFVAGEAKPAGSKVSGVATRWDAEKGRRVPVLRPGSAMPKTFTKDSSGPAGAAWRADVRAAAEAVMGGEPPLDGPLSLSVTFYRSRPKSHYGSGRNAAVLKPTAPSWPITRPDATKLLRAIEDAMLGIVYADDSQLVAIFARKEYADAGRIGASVTVSTASRSSWVPNAIPNAAPVPGSHVAPLVVFDEDVSPPQLRIVP